MATKFNFPDVIPASELAWYQDQLARSGITEKLAESAGMVLKPGKFLIPYFDINGEPTGLVKARARVESGDKYGTDDVRYVVVQGKGALPYWTKFPELNHKKELNDLDHSLWVVEGEKKAICLQAQIFAQGYTGSVVGIGGHNHIKPLIKDLETLPFSVNIGQDVAQRQVVIALDWNSPDPKIENQVRLSEQKLYNYFKERGAEVLMLRWDASEGEQKIDDWLVAGGQLSEAIKYSRSHAAELVKATDALGESLEFFQANFGKLNGMIIKLADAYPLTAEKFKTQYMHKFSKIPTDRGAPRKLRHADAWIEWEHVRQLSGICFQPWGVQDQREHPEILDGKLNLFRGWKYQPEPGDVTLWTEHLEHALPNEEHRAWFTKWVAHMIQRPSEMVSTYVCLVSQRQGTGKGIIVRGLRAMFGDDYVAAGDRESWLGRFNANWGGKLLVVTDEVKTYNVREHRSMGERIKEVVGSPKLSIEAKGRDIYETDNHLRFLFTGNREQLTFLDQNDRRAVYFDTPEVLDPKKGAEIVEWLKLPSTPPALLQWALDVDISEFEPGARGIETEAKRDAILANLSDEEHFAIDIKDEVLLAGRYVWRTEEIFMAFEQIYGKYHSGIRNLAARLRKLGAISARIDPTTKAEINLHRVGGKMVRLWCVRGIEEWRHKSPQEWIEESLKSV